jgi:hypothetical protein
MAMIYPPPTATATSGAPFLPHSPVARPIEMLHYSISQPVAVVIAGSGGMPILQQALEAVRTYQPMTPASR